MITFIYLIAIAYSIPQFAEVIFKSQNGFQLAASIALVCLIWYGVGWILGVERFWNNIFIYLFDATFGSVF